MGNKKVKCVYVANARFPTEKAHGIQIAKMCEAFADLDIDLTLVVPSRKNETTDAQLFYDLKQSLYVKRLWSINVFPSTSFGFRLSSLSFALSSFLYLLFRGRKYDVFYSVDMDHVSYVGIALVRRLIKKSFFIEMHAPKHNTLIHRLLFQKVNGVIAINKEIQENLAKTFPVLKNKILVCPNGVDVFKYATLNKTGVRNKLGVSVDDICAVYTGSFQDWKGIETIVAAANSVPNITFYLVGGSEREVETLLRTMHVSSNVKCVGHRDWKEIPLWQVSADILLATGTRKNKYSSLHTSPMKLFEYMASGVPIVASRTHAIEQIVGDEHVFFHTPDDASDLVRVLENVLQQTDECKKKVAVVLKLAEQYSWSTRAQKIKKNIIETL